MQHERGQRVVLESSVDANASYGLLVLQGWNTIAYTLDNEGAIHRVPPGSAVALASLVRGADAGG